MQRVSSQLLSLLTVIAAMLLSVKMLHLVVMYYLALCYWRLLIAFMMLFEQ